MTTVMAAGPRSTGPHGRTVMSLAAVAIALPLVVVGAVAGVVTGDLIAAVVVSVAVAAAIAALVVLPPWRHAEGKALVLIGGYPADGQRHARLFNLVDGLCATAGLRRPQLVVIDDPAPNACALGRGPRHGCVVVTQGLLDQLNRIELEAVLAHELAHLRRGETAAPTAVLALLARVRALQDTGLARVLLARTVPRDRETLADLSGVAQTRYPPGLISALDRVQETPLRVRDVPRLSAPLWFAPLATDDTRGLERRIEALRQL